MICPHGMPSPGSCVECMDEGLLPPPARPAPPAVVARFSARFDGHCSGCNLGISAGQTIVSLDNGEYRHDGCES